MYDAFGLAIWIYIDITSKFGERTYLNLAMCVSK